MTRILRYILQHDTGMAPCVDNGLVSLATCKPKIRAGARSGEWVIGFRPSPAPRGLMVWAGRVPTVSKLAIMSASIAGGRTRCIGLSRVAALSGYGPTTTPDRTSFGKTYARPCWSLTQMQHGTLAGNHTCFPSI
jgi:hypothetical protein